MKKVLFFLLLFVITLAIIPLFLSKTMHVEDEYVFDAPVDQVYNHFVDLTKFTDFDAWSVKDPNVQINYSSPAIGDSAYYEWESKELGNGSMKITETAINQFIRYELKFAEMTGNTVEVIFQEMEDGQTRVVWSFDSGEATYPFQVFNLLMKGTVKDNLHLGMANLDSILIKESQSPKELSPNVIKIVTEERHKLFGVLQHTSTQGEEMGTAMAETFGLVFSYLHDAQGLTEDQIGNPVVLWKQYDETTDNALFYCGFFIEQEVDLTDEFESVEVPAGKYLSTIHKGSYDDLSKTYVKLFEYGENQNLELSRETFDVYLNSPNNTEETNLKTQIFVPIIN